MRHLLPVAAVAANLARISWIYSFKRPGSVLSFAFRHRLQTRLTTGAPFPFLFSIVFMPKTRFRKNFSASRTPALLPVPFVKERAESRTALWPQHGCPA